MTIVKASEAWEVPIPHGVSARALSTRGMGYRL